MQKLKNGMQASRRIHALMAMVHRIKDKYTVMEIFAGHGILTEVATLRAGGLDLRARPEECSH